MADAIEVRGARENNLRDVDVDVPLDRITVFTGVSGSGKSSLVFDTIAAESQRQLNETFPAFVRNRLPQLGKPDVDSLRHLSASVVVDQRPFGGNARSTVGTATDLAPLLREDGDGTELLTGHASTVRTDSSADSYPCAHNVPSDFVSLASVDLRRWRRMGRRPRLG